MKSGPILAIIAAGAVFGWLAPDLAYKPVASAGQPAKEFARVDVATRDQWNAGEVVLRRSDDGHFYADVTVDAGSAHMLVDTGASVVALTGEDADAMGLSWDPEQVRPIARGASGAVYGVEVTLGHVQLGGLEADEVQAIVVPEGLGISLLGQSFLSQIERVEIDQDKMLLGG